MKDSENPTAGELAAGAVSHGAAAFVVVRLKRFVRKHAVLLVSIAAFNFVLFFPLLFMGRQISPNDVFFNYAPWSLYRTADTQNSLLNDPPTSYLTMMSLLRTDWSSFHWNPYVASGIPGFGSAGAASLTPFVLLPVFLLSFSAVYSGIIFLKLNLAFLFGYLWLREERLGKSGAAAGAAVIGGAGIYAVHWLWQITNATALFPALLWVVARTARGKRNSVALLTLLVVSYAMAGFPATMAYGAYCCGAYLLFLCARERRVPVRSIAVGALAVILGLLVVSPSLAAFVQFVHRTGYLESRAAASLQHFFPPSHWMSFIAPERLGNPAYRNWFGDRSLGALNNFVESTIYLGFVLLPFIPIGMFARRARSRWFWAAAALIVLGCMFGIGPLFRLIADVPGFRYSALTRTMVLLPIAAGYLAAGGVAFVSGVFSRGGSTRRSVTRLACAALGIAAAADLALFAARSFPYLEPGATRVPETPVIRFLHEQKGPFRVAPTFDYLWPNSAELFRFEDIRSHFSSEARYRDMLLQIDPTCWSGHSTVLQFNSLKFDFTHPFVSLLGVRYLIEHKAIDIIRWSIYKATVPGVKEVGALVMKPGQTLLRTIDLTPKPFWAIELPISVEVAPGSVHRVVVSLLDPQSSRVLFQRTYEARELREMIKIYIPAPSDRSRVILSVTTAGLSATLLKSEPAAGEAPLFYGRVQTPIILDRELPDGRVFRNLAEVPRFEPVWEIRRMSPEDFLHVRDIDFRTTAAVTGAEASVDDVSAVPPARRTALLQLSERRGADQELRVRSAVPFLLASSEKLTPELRILVDGREAATIEINGIFAGVRIPPGEHQVVFSRRIGRGWWPLALLGVIVWLGVAAVEVWSGLARR